MEKIDIGRPREEMARSGEERTSGDGRVVVAAKVDNSLDDRTIELTDVLMPT